MLEEKYLLIVCISWHLIRQVCTNSQLSAKIREGIKG